MKKAIVTGAFGFLGSWLVRMLVENDFEVIALVRPSSSAPENLQGIGFRTVYCDLHSIADLPQLAPDRDVDVLFHFGWNGFMDSANMEAQWANVPITINCIAAAAEMGIGTFVGAGSFAEPEAHFELAKGGVVTDPAFAYKAAKVAAHYFAKVKAGTCGLRFFWPVVTNAYGPGERNNRLITHLLRTVLQGKPFALSEGRQLYDFVYVSDVAKAFLLVHEKGVDSTEYIIGSGHPRPLKNFLKEAGELLHVSDLLEFGKVTSNVHHLPVECFSPVQLVEHTGFSPAVPFQEGIQRTANWVKEHIDTGK